MADLSFYYWNVMRFTLNLRFYALDHSTKLPRLEKVLLFFSVRNISNLENPSSYNYFYLFRFFLGRRAYITRYSSFFSLRQTYHSFDICLLYRKQEVFFPVSFYINDISLLLGLHGYNCYFSLPLVFNLILWDTNMFIEKKGNLGLFSLADPLNYRFFLSNGDFFSSLLFLHSLKLDFDDINL